MISDKKNTEDDFMCYLAERVSPAQLSKLYRCYSEIETFCLKIKVLQTAHPTCPTMPSAIGL